VKVKVRERAPSPLVGERAGVRGPLSEAIEALEAGDATKTQKALLVTALKTLVKEVQLTKADRSQVMKLIESACSKARSPSR